MLNFDIALFGYDVCPAVPFELSRKARCLLRYVVTRVYFNWAGKTFRLPRDVQTLLYKVAPTDIFTQELYDLHQDERAIKVCEYIAWELLDDCRIAHGSEVVYTFDNLLEAIKANSLAMTLLKWKPDMNKSMFRFTDRHVYARKFRKALNKLTPAFVFMVNSMDEIISEYQL